MMKTLNPDERFDALGRATRMKTPENQHPMRCSDCADLYYVDESSYREFKRSIEYDPSDYPFLCDRCREERSEGEHSPS
jgi:hypothetical protein